MLLIFLLSSFFLSPSFFFLLSIVQALKKIFFPYLLLAEPTSSLHRNKLESRLKMTQVGVNIFGIFKFLNFLVFLNFWKQKNKMRKINDRKIKIEKISNLNCLIENINNTRQWRQKLDVGYLTSVPNRLPSNKVISKVSYPHGLSFRPNNYRYLFL